MQFQSDDKKHYDFQMTFENDCDFDAVINNFFSEHTEIIGHKEYITYRIKKQIELDKRFLNAINGKRQDVLNRIGKVSYVRHDVIPEQNGGKEFYIYLINTFI